MPIRLKIDVGHILEITDEFEHIDDLINAEIQRRGGIPPGVEAYDAVAFPIFEALQDLIRSEFGVIKGEDLRGPRMKEVVHSWIEDRLAEIEG
ncbi:hypothetical protein [Methanoculleus sp.]|uniref:hypothetical protein n=1 Tax=Methanoculleus sp. TaxID=90427 RepID=UPI0025DDB300|nr:hypothetical protein [Methanoculleus sp.]